MAHVRGRVRRAAQKAARKVGSVYSVSAVAALECKRSAWTGLPNHCRQCNVELEGRRTAWCSDECHRYFEVNHIWDEARQEILTKAQHCCEREDCSVKRDLQVNHINPVVGQGYHPSCYHHLDNLEALCRPHHQIETNAQREYRKQNWTAETLTGEITLPHEDLDQELREDLTKRMLDRKSGWPFIQSRKAFTKTGQIHYYRPNTKWEVALADLILNYPKALMWSPSLQTWRPAREYATFTPCGTKNKNGKQCSRLTVNETCWQH